MPHKKFLLYHHRITVSALTYTEIKIIAHSVNGLSKRAVRKGEYEAIGRRKGQELPHTLTISTQSIFILKRNIENTEMYKMKT